jgi:hypothetical protein
MQSSKYNLFSCHLETNCSHYNASGLYVAMSFHFPVEQKPHSPAYASSLSHPSDRDGCPCETIRNVRYSSLTWQRTWAREHCYIPSTVGFAGPS